MRSALRTLALGCLSLCSFSALASDNYSILEHSENLAYERDLLAKHNQLARRYNENYDAINIAKQPANKTEKCLISSDQFDGFMNSNTLIFWEGSCQNDRADGFGRAYIVTNGRMVFEMLANFNSESPQHSTTYYSKNTFVPYQTVFFYGKANRLRSSGITITKRDIDHDLSVAMQFIDKANLITYSKATSKNVHYVLNTKDLGNYTHFIHDLNNTPYRSLFMSYKLVNNTNSQTVGYSFMGLKNGSLNGEYSSQNRGAQASSIPRDVIQHVIETNEEIENNVEDSIKNVIESLPVVDAYLNVVCDEKYQNPVCTKMKCKQICDVNYTITPDFDEVKSLLLRLVEHHNKRPLKVYLEHQVAYLMQQQQFGTDQVNNGTLISPDHVQNDMQDLRRGLPNMQQVAPTPVPAPPSELLENPTEVDTHELRRSRRTEELSAKELLEATIPSHRREDSRGAISFDSGEVVESFNLHERQQQQQNR